MLQKNYPTPKKICRFAPVNSALKTLKPSNAQFGGYWDCTLDSVPETKQETKMGRHCSSNRQRNGQGISDLEIRKRIQDPPRQW